MRFSAFVEDNTIRECRIVHECLCRFRYEVARIRIELRIAPEGSFYDGDRYGPKLTALQKACGAFLHELGYDDTTQISVGRSIVVFGVFPERVWREVLYGFYEPAAKMIHDFMGNDRAV